MTIGRAALAVEPHRIASIGTGSPVRRLPRLRELDRQALVAMPARNVLGFEITNRGPAGPDSGLLFLSQDPGSHHQIAMVGGVEGILQICHGNAWSLYFSDCEGNGLESLA